MASRSDIAHLQVTYSGHTLLDSSLPAAVRKSFCVGCGLCRQRRQSPHPTSAWTSRRWRQSPIHFKEDVLQVKRSRFRIVILSAAKDLSPDRDPSLRSELAQDAKRRDDKARC